MKVHWYARSDKENGGRIKYLDRRVMGAFKRGLERTKDTLKESRIHRFDGDTYADLAICYGYSEGTRTVVDAYLSAGKHVLVFDKGMIRVRNRTHKSRVMIDGGDPLKYMLRIPRDPGRWQQAGIKLRHARSTEPDAPIVFAMNSQKHCGYFGIKDGQEYSRWVVSEIRKHTDRPIVFRPKPKATPFVPIEGTTYSTKPDHIEDALGGAFCLVTHTSSCAINALIMGIPTICLGPCAASPVSSNDLADVVDPRFPAPKAYNAWLNALAWAEWGWDEFDSGQAWQFIKQEIKCLPTP